jgi:hypothetical protein
MQPLLADTSVWIDFLNGTDNEQSRLLEKYLQADARLYLCPVILMEILQGIKNEDQFRKTKSILLNFPMLQLDPIDAALGAASLYRKLRAKGVTIRKSNDCLIAFYAIHFKITLLHRDNDFEKIALHLSLKTV